MKKVLVVDDRPANVMLLEDILEDAGYQVFSAMDGKQGLQQARANHPDLIISDILMPNMDGFEFCHQVRTTPELSATPFLFLTGAYVGSDDEQFALKIGANRFIRRPFQNQELLDTVQILVSTEQDQIPSGLSELDEKYYLKEHINRLTQALEDKVIELEAVMEQNVRLLKDAKRHEAELRKNLTELQETQAYLVQSERLSAVGQLVAGVAHELNNPLAIILGYAQLMIRMPEITPRMSECLSKLEEAGQRCQRIVHHLTIFAQKQKAEKRYVNINDALSSVLDIRKDQLQADHVAVTTEFDPRLLVVFADFQQLQQVFLSILNNAREALMTQNRLDRSIRLVTRLQDDFVAVDIIDNGPGIGEGHLSRLFDPFFTTKEFGKGIGLGLSVCYGIIKEHQGDIKVSHTEGGGATFTITLPLHRITRPEERPEEPEAAQESSPVGFRILIIDDEPGILDILASTFRQAGYTVDTVRRGDEGFARATRNPYDLVLLDIWLPDVDGKTLYQNIVAHRPELKTRILFITGDTVSPNTMKFIERTGNQYLAKPFDIEKVRRLVANLLSNP
jgi:two-component system NtrC family sensor kinase